MTWSLSQAYTTFTRIIQRSPKKAYAPSKTTTLLGYELIWNNLTFNTQCFVELNRKHIQAKVEALKAYESQGTRDYLSEEFIFSLAKTRGVQAGCPYAEAFEVVRLFL